MANGKFKAILQLGFALTCIVVIAFVIGMMVQDFLTGRASTAPNGYVEFHGVLYLCEPAGPNLIVINNRLHKISGLPPETAQQTQTAPAN